MTNDAPLPIDQPGPYAQTLLDALADRDPLELLAATPQQIDALLAGLADDAVRRPEADGKWSMLEVLHHLADSDLVTGFRLRMIVAEDRPPIIAYDQDRWATNLGYRNAQLADVLDQFRALRAANVRFARSLTPEQLQRYGVHTERGGESAGYFLRLMAGHDVVHLRQLERIRRAVA